ncbi:hypothetical protein GCM10009776_01820 [Microbacterium deminutum]|uniref:Bacterial transcriptional activator domain-containing protein n=1 Tax=Microbacterium deminutum TaxID=344164 RepID=A0ABP5BFM0_9MICO
MRVAVLGPVMIATADGAAVPLPGAHTRSLIAALAVGGQTVHSADALVEDIWGAAPPRNPRASLQTLVSRVRAVAGADLVRSDPAGYSLGIPSDAVDLERARRLVDAAAGIDEGDPTGLALVDEALSLWRGEAGADLGDSDLGGIVADVAGAIRDRAEALRARALLSAGRTGEAVVMLAALCDARPYDESMHAELMGALAADGRTQEALAVFAGLRARLRDDLGASPGAAVTALNTRLVRGDAPTRAPSRLRIGLRAAHTPLLGRDADVAALPPLLARHRLVTILGAGGLGKTRLAQAVAAASDAPGVLIVELASVRAGDDVASAIGAAMGLNESPAGGRIADALTRPDLRARVVAFLAERPTLLVLDNCEQVIDAVARWVADMLAAVASLRVLTTSRTPLAIAAEAVYPLAVLRSEPDDPDSVGPAAQLFLDRARAVRPDALLPVDVVVRLCQRLDGLPLAIELAAARVRSMTPEQIEVRLRDRFALLTTADRAAPERHRTLQAVIEWSWDLVDSEARGALTTLSLLPAGFTAPTAAAVLGIPFAEDLLDRLVSQSLLIVADDADTGALRFRMLETVREFGQSRLVPGDRELDAWNAVLGWARGYATDRVDHVLEPSVYRALHSEHDNLLSVLRYAIDHDRAADAVAIAAVLGQAWIVRGSFSELITLAPAVRRLEAAAAVEDVSPDARAVTLILGVIASQALGGTGILRSLARLRMTLRRGGVSDRWAAFARAITASADEERFAVVVEELRGSQKPAIALMGELIAAQYAENEGDAASAMVAARRAWEIADEAGDVWVAATAASTAATLASQSARPAEALEWLDRSVAGFQAFGAENELRQQAWARGGSLVSLGRLDEARALFGELAGLRDRTDDGLELASIGWFGLAEVDRASGDAAGAAVRYERAMERFTTNDQRESPWFLMAMAGLISATSFDSSLPPERIAWWAGRLRTRAIALRRARPQFVDKPVVGTVLSGWSAWAITQPELRDRGIETLAIAALLGARQDLPSLHLSEHFAQAEALAGAEAYARGVAAASALPPQDRVDRAFALLSGSR